MFSLASSEISFTLDRRRQPYQLRLMQQELRFRRTSLQPLIPFCAGFEQGPMRWCDCLLTNRNIRSELCQRWWLQRLVVEWQQWHQVRIYPSSVEAPSIIGTPISIILSFKTTSLPYSLPSKLLLTSVLILSGIISIFFTPWLITGCAIILN